MLHRGVHGKHIELVHLAKLGRECRRSRDKAHFPAGHVVSLSKARHNERALSQAGVAGGAFVRGAVKHHVLIHLVAHHPHIGGRQQGLQGQHVGAAPDGAAGVVRRVDDDGAGLGRQGGGDFCKVGPKGARRQRHAHHHATAEHDIGLVAVVAGFEHDHLVAGVHQRQQSGKNGLGGARGDGDLVCRAVVASVQAFHLLAHRLAQRGHASHGRVLVVASAHGGSYLVNERRVAGKVRKTLAQVHRLVLGCERRHDGKNRGAHVGQATLNRNGAGHGVKVRRCVRVRAYKSASFRWPAMARSTVSRVRRLLSSSAKV